MMTKFELIKPNTPEELTEIIATYIFLWDIKKIRTYRDILDVLSAEVKSAEEQHSDKI